MYITHLILAILFAVLFTVLLIPLGGHRTRREESGAGVAFLFFFLLFLPFIWAGGLWMTPFGPMVYEVAWMPFLLVGFLVMLLIVVTLPADRGQGKLPPSETGTASKGEERAVKVFGGAYLLLLVGLFILILLHYTRMW
jgi:hypothetical protein